MSADFSDSADSHNHSENRRRAAAGPPNSGRASNPRLPCTGRKFSSTTPLTRNAPASKLR